MAATIKRDRADVTKNLLGSGAFQLIDRARRDLAKPDGDQAERDGKPDICDGAQHFAVPHEIQRLQAERRQSGVAAAHSRHHELTSCGADEEAPVWTGQRREKADDETARDIDDDRAPGKRLSDLIADRRRDPEARRAAKRAPRHNPEIKHKARSLSNKIVVDEIDRV